jgi:hypothetical protein
MPALLWTSRRALISSALSISPLAAIASLAPARPARARPVRPTQTDVHYVGSEVPDRLADIFKSYVCAVKEAIGDSFEARLVVYGVSTGMPAGMPGDPARDYSGNRKYCGEFQKPGGFPSQEPYALCSDETCTSEEKIKCCRHYAYCVPYDRFPATPLDAVSTVVVSSRIVNLPEETIRGILAHELGHAVDFHAFGKRYRLKNRPVEMVSSELEARMRMIDAAIDDVEYRADDLANVLLLEGTGQRLCYDPKTLLQSVRHEASCGPLGDDHYSHPVLRRPII